MKTLIFDFDGTIADSFGVLLATFERVVNQSKPLSDEEVARLRGKSLKQIIKILNIKSWQLPRLLLKSRRDIKRRFGEVKPFEGLPEIIKQLHNDEFEMYIVSTNNAKVIDQFLKTNQIDGCFHRVYGDIGLGGKARALSKVIKNHRLNKADCTYIGDEVRDIEAAKKVGIRSVSVGWGFNFPEALQKAKPSALAQHPEDLLQILINPKLFNNVDESH